MEGSTVPNRKPNHPESKLLKRVLTGISVLTSRPTENVHPALSAYNAPATSLSAEPFRGCEIIPKPEATAVLTDLSFAKTPQNPELRPRNNVIGGSACYSFQTHF